MCAATAGPKRREALATGARHRKLDAGFYTFFICKNKQKSVAKPTLCTNNLSFCYILLLFKK
jgi:hypothetical protein